MSDTTEICNLAAIHARQDASIVDLDTDTSTLAIRLRKIYNPTLARLAQSFPWHFCTKPISLAQLDKDAYDGWDYVYSIPSNVLEVQKVSQEDGMFRETFPGTELNIFKVFPSSDGLTKEIHARFELAQALVVTTVVTDAILDPLVVEHFSYELAKQLASLYKVSTKEKELILIEAAAAKNEAMMSSAMQEDVEFDAHNRYVNSRGEVGTNGSDVNIDL